MLLKMQLMLNGCANEYLQYMKELVIYVNEVDSEWTRRHIV